MPTENPGACPPIEIPGFVEEIGVEKLDAAAVGGGGEENPGVDGDGAKPLGGGGGAPRFGGGGGTNALDVEEV